MLIAIDREIFLPFALWSFAAGLFFGAVYDVFRIRRAAFRRSAGLSHGGRFGRFLSKNIDITDTLLTFFEDIIFFVFCSVTLILINYKLNFGYPRWYSAASCLGGFLLYHVTLGRLVMAAEELILRAVSASVRFIIGITVRPAGRFAAKLISEAEKRSEKRYTEKCEKLLLSAISDRMKPFCDNTEE